MLGGFIKGTLKEGQAIMWGLIPLMVKCLWGNFEQSHLRVTKGSKMMSLFSSICFARLGIYLVISHFSS